MIHSSDIMLNGQIFILSAPSGAGKTSLLKALVEGSENIKPSISHTTRARREGEIEDVHYHFIDEHEFSRMVEEQEFVEHASVFNSHYGTSYAAISDGLKAGFNIVLDIDWQGALQVKKHFPQSTSIFILPPSIDILEQRLKGRGQDNDEVIRYRMQQAHEEMLHCREYDYIVINDDFDETLKQLKHIVLNDMNEASAHKTATFEQSHAELLEQLTFPQRISY